MVSRNKDKFYTKEKPPKILGGFNYKNKSV
jgi:hypothetical protein